jgi:DNA helicase-2/ATP-dependent DNA helicase PcrA
MTALRPGPDGGYLRELLGRDFTDEQMAIITAPLGPQLVVAGAGSGKTMVIAARVVHAVACFDVAPSAVLGLTFTNKAAGELAERVRQSLARLDRAGVEADGSHERLDDAPTVATYHAYAAQIVRDHALRIGREPGAALLTQATQWQLAMRVATSAPGPFAHLDWTTGYVAGLVVALAGDLSDHLATADDVRRHDARVRSVAAAIDKPVAGVKELLSRVAARDELLDLVSDYAVAKERLGVIDFADQVALACEIVRAAPAVAASERARYRLVVLDEYQDTGVSQRTLLSTIFADAHAVTAVGDPNQAIYGWRGASAGNLIRFGEHFAPSGPEVRTQPMMTSFRCAERVLGAANAVIEPLAISRAGAADIPALRPAPGATAPGAVVVTRSDSALDEADWVADQVAAALADGVARREIAVLTRRRVDFSRLHRAMAERGIPVEVVGLGGLLAMPEVGDLVALLSVLVNPTANAAAVRLLTGPRWRIGVRDLAALGRRAAWLTRERSPEPDDEEDESDEGAVTARLDEVLASATASIDPVEVPSLIDATESPGQPAAYSAEALARLEAFTAEVRALRRVAGQPIVDLIAEVIRVIGLDVEIGAGDPALAEARTANVHAFLDVASRFTGLDGEGDLSAFLAYLRAAEDNEDGLDVGMVSDADTVKLMTIHSAKGLEWDVVVVPGLVETVFPTQKSRASWVSGAHVLPFACRGDAADLPVLTGYENADLKAFKQQCADDSMAEERRLAYVAFTRARSRLMLSSYVWSPTRKQPVAVSRFLSEVRDMGEPLVTVDGWSPDPEPGTTNPLMADEVEDIPWPEPPDADRQVRLIRAAELVGAARGDRAHSQPVASADGSEPALRWHRDAGVLLDEIRRRRRRVIEVAVPARLTTSQVVALAHDPDAFAAALARPVPARPVPQARRGSRFHQWVEQLYGAAPLLEPDDLPGAQDADLTDTELAALQERFLADGWGERRPVAVEAPFEMTVGGRLIRGRIDAVYRDGQRHDVIDFKTGAVPGDFSAAALQLAVYRIAWADLAGVALDRVDAGFLYVRTGELRRPDRLLDRRELDELLSGGDCSAAFPE